jgi:hypothetical protein
MMKGYLDTTDTSATTVTVSGLPPGYTSGGYDVYLYADGGNNSASGKQGQYTIGGTTIALTDRPAADFNGTFKLANNGTGNGIVFTKRTDPSFTLTAKANPQEKGGRAPLNGLQLVGNVAGAPPMAPIRLAANALSRTSVRVTWTDAASDETAYRVEHAPAGSNTWTAGPQLPADSKESIVGGLQAGTSYDFRVTALGAGGVASSVTAKATLSALEK